MTWHDNDIQFAVSEGDWENVLTEALMQDPRAQVVEEFLEERGLLC